MNQTVMVDAMCPECKHMFDEELTFDDPFPGDVDFNSEFFRLGAQCADEFGGDWLIVNNAIRDALLHAGMDHSNHRIRWLAYCIARGVCLLRKRENEIQG